MAELRPLLQIEDILSAQDVHPCRLALWVSVHRVGLAGAGLSVGEACDLSSKECTLHNRPNTLRIDLHGFDSYALVGGILIEGRIEVEVVFIDELGEIDLLPTFPHPLLHLPDNNRRPGAYLHNIGFPSLLFLLVQRSLPDHHAYFGLVFNVHRCR